MSELWMVLNENEKPLSLLQNPWGDGESLCDSTLVFITLFLHKTDAQKALRQTKKYAKNKKLYDTWKMPNWKIIKAELSYAVRNEM